MSLVKSYLYHTNDLHSDFTYWPNIVSYLEEKRQHHQERGEDYFYFDIGDHADRCHPITEATMGKANVTLLNKAGVRAITIGNNEGITFSKKQLDEFYEEANFDILIANLYEKDGRRPKWIKPYKIIELQASVKAAVIGVTFPYTRIYEQLGWKVEEPFQMLQPLIHEVKKKVDIVILLSHLGLNLDEKLAEEVDGIDIILGAHTHHILEHGKRVRDTLICQTGKFGQFVGTVELVVDKETKQLVSTQAFLQNMSNDKADKETDAYLAQLKEQSTTWSSSPITVLHKPLDVDWFAESEGVQFLAEALKEWCQTDISMLNAGVLLESLPEGPITKGDIHRVCPHPINPCVITIRGKELKEVIHRSQSEEMMNFKLKGLGFRGKVIGKMVFIGITIANHENCDPIITVLGNVLQEEEHYRIATLDMFTFGKLYPSILDAIEIEYLLPEMLRDVLMWKLQSL
ncbi:bifunctional metallophosphatase/5'-nucleotidase [Alkalihalobacterium bogoriense]|uniref:bifunctional metallophosphatase/5'-nucleotidase n=1 Tax=Alkalihalobacterium bogoriense TaxID=246272 RepID=UPI00047BF87A|nr:bifunctional UDP-sugar hydrolase/5'-nucleotidase [Alkalihalobacterium bogoriense]